MPWILEYCSSKSIFLVPLKMGSDLQEHTGGIILLPVASFDKPPAPWEEGVGFLEAGAKEGRNESGQQKKAGPQFYQGEGGMAEEQECYPVCN